MTFSLVGSAGVVDNSTERMENISESITLPVQETGSQGRSQLCLNAKCYTTLPDGIVTGVTVQLPRSLPSSQHDKKVDNSLEISQICFSTVVATMLCKSLTLHK